MFPRYYASLSSTIQGKRCEQLGVDFNTENEHCSDKGRQGRFEFEPEILLNPD
jgi:hypothetical protein